MKSLIILLIFLVPSFLIAQVGVNDTGAQPHAGAILDVVSSTKGVLLPRTQAAQITNPTTGMVIYDTDTEGFRYYNGTQWTTLLEEGAYSFWWADQDGDGYGYPFNVIYSPTAPEFFVGNNDDCNDQDNQIGPGSAEVCDGIDNDCDGQIDDGNPEGGALCGSSIGECQQGVVTCVDGELICLGEVIPQPEICDGLDNDCDGDIDEFPVDGTSFWPDADGDTFGNANASPVIACTAPNGYVANAFDCNDANSTINPNATEVCDFEDNDCDGEIDECDFGGVCCTGICIDVQSDPNNCGDCNLSCDDGDACTTDVCVNGQCQHIPIDCNDSNPCTDDYCIDGVCFNTPSPSTTECPGGYCDGAGACIPDQSLIATLLIRRRRKLSS